ncbi:MAG: CRISPR-associated protein Cas4 [Desulfurococcaceae archaeon TW002]
MGEEPRLDLINLLYTVSKEEKEKHPRKPDTYWVTDLVRCVLKRDYELKYPELIEKEVFTPVFILGTLVHKGLQELLKSTIGEEVLTEVEGSREVILPDGRKVMIEGRADVIVKINNKMIGVEIKTARSDYDLPKPHHVDQAKIYNWLFNLKHTILVYVTPERVTQYIVSDKVSEEDIVDRITTKNIPRYDWECKFCSYSVMCPYKVPSK